MLESLIQAGFEIVKVATQPDRPAGRDHLATESAVKILAKKHNLEVTQPEKLKEFSLGSDHDLNVVCQYGLIIPKAVLDAPKKGSINVHTSLLPKYRGASPIQSAIINGENETGVTVMLMDEKMDHGNILSQTKILIEKDEKYLELQKRMEKPASTLLIETLKAYLSGKINPVTQNDSEATYCTTFSRDDGRIDWKKPAIQIYDLYRGLTPWPGIWTTWNNKRLKLLSVSPSLKNVPAGIVKIEDSKIFVGTDKGSLLVTELQMEGKKAVQAKDFVSGYRDFNGSKLD